MQRILFLDDCNGYESYNPKAYLVEIPSPVTVEDLYSLERLQPGVMRMGGNWRKILEDANIPYSKLSYGVRSDYRKEDYDLLYTVISGNY